MRTETEPIFRNAKHARETGRRYRRMADEISRYPDHEGQQEKVSDLRGRSAHAYRAARTLELQPPAEPKPRTPRQAKEPPTPEWTPKKALRRAGVRTAERADKAARSAPGRASRAARRNTPALGGNPTSPGGLLIYVFVSIVGLALLDSVLGGRGPAAVSNTLGFLTGAIQRLFSPTDPLIPRGVQPSPLLPLGTTKVAVVPGVTNNRGFGVPVDPNSGSVSPRGVPIDPVTGKPAVAA